VTQRPFVTSITPVVGDFAVAQQPVIVVLNEGTQLNVQGIVSDDKRFVRLTLVPFFSQIGDVDTFTFEGRRTTRSSSRDENGDTNGDGVIDDSDEVDETSNLDVIEGTTVQLPTFAFTQVSTTVSVPDGGTILLGGIKRLAEGRSERGVPMLSKIPYISRLFRNVSVGRDARSLMLMVTPRIIIQEEEELAQTGFDPTR
jgi:general secretion pathway protein D